MVHIIWYFSVFFQTSWYKFLTFYAFRIFSDAFAQACSVEGTIRYTVRENSLTSFLANYVQFQNISPKSNGLYDIDYIIVRLKLPEKRWPSQLLTGIPNPSPLDRQRHHFDT